MLETYNLTTTYVSNLKIFKSKQITLNLNSMRFLGEILRLSTTSIDEIVSSIIMESMVLFLSCYRILNYFILRYY